MKQFSADGDDDDGGDGDDDGGDDGDEDCGDVDSNAKDNNKNSHSNTVPW